jgi:plasmid maintenance system antidote protein VapI
MLKKLREIQKRERLTDGEMAEKLGCSRPSWNLMKNGHRELRDEWAVRAAGVWPELSRDLLALAAESAVSGTNIDRQPSTVAVGQ